MFPHRRKPWLRPKVRVPHPLEENTTECPEHVAAAAVLEELQVSWQTMRERPEHVTAAAAPEEEIAQSDGQTATAGASSHHSETGQKTDPEVGKGFRRRGASDVVEVTGPDSTMLVPESSQGLLPAWVPQDETHRLEQIVRQASICRLEAQIQFLRRQLGRIQEEATRHQELSRRMHQELSRRPMPYQRY